MGGNDRSSTANDRLPPSCRYVLDVIEREGDLSRQELIEETGLHERTVDRALERLAERGKIRETRDSGDLRQKVVIMTTM